MYVCFWLCNCNTINDIQTSKKFNWHKKYPGAKMHINIKVELCWNTGIRRNDLLFAFCEFSGCHAEEIALRFTQCTYKFHKTLLFKINTVLHQNWMNNESFLEYLHFAPQCTWNQQKMHQNRINSSQNAYIQLILCIISCIFCVLE